MLAMKESVFYQIYRVYFKWKNKLIYDRLDASIASNIRIY